MVVFSSTRRGFLLRRGLETISRRTRGGRLSGYGELIRRIPYESAKDWGQAGWVSPLIDCMFDGATKVANHQMRMFLGDHYFRLQVTLDEAMTIWMMRLR